MLFAAVPFARGVTLANGHALQTLWCNRIGVQGLAGK